MRPEEFTEMQILFGKWMNECVVRGMMPAVLVALKIEPDGKIENGEVFVWGALSPDLFAMIVEIIAESKPFIKPGISTNKN